MKQLTAAVAALALVVMLSTPQSVAAQTPVQRGRTLDVLFFSTAGATTLAFGATYPFSFVFDGTLNYATTTSGTSEVNVGARYWFPVRPAGLAPYLGAGLIFATGTGTFVGGGVTLGLAPGWNGYAGINVRSVGGTSTTALDVGAQFVFTSLVSGVIGVGPVAGPGGTVTSNLYLGITFSY